MALFRSAAAKHRRVRCSPVPAERRPAEHHAVSLTAQRSCRRYRATGDPRAAPAPRTAVRMSERTHPPWPVLAIILASVGSAAVSLSARVLIGHRRRSVSSPRSSRSCVRQPPRISSPAELRIDPVIHVGKGQRSNDVADRGEVAGLAHRPRSVHRKPHRASDNGDVRGLRPADWWFAARNGAGVELISG